MSFGINFPFNSSSAANQQGNQPQEKSKKRISLGPVIVDEWSPGVPLEKLKDQPNNEDKKLLYYFTRPDCV